MCLRSMPNVFDIYPLVLWVRLVSSLLLKIMANMDFWTVRRGLGRVNSTTVRHVLSSCKGRWGEKGGVGTTVKALYIIM